MADEKAPQTESKSNTGGDIDRVQQASRRPDGSAHQTPGWEYIGDKQIALDGTKRQLAEQAVSAKDVELRGAVVEPAAGEVGSSEPDAEVKKLKDAHDKAAKSAEARAESEVNAKHPDKS